MCAEDRGKDLARVGSAVLAVVLGCAGLAAPSRASPAGQTPAPAGSIQVDEEILGAPSPLSGTPPARTLHLAAGTRLRQEPDFASPVIALVEVDIELVVLAHAGRWRRVLLGTRKGWASLDPEPEPAAEEGPGASPAVSAAAPGAVAGPAAEDRERLVRAARLLGLPDEGAGTTADRLGPWRLLTDLPAGRLRQRLAVVAAALPPAYGERYGLPAEPAAPQAVVLFSRDEDYRAYARAEASLAGFSGEGHATGRVAALAAGGRSAEQVTELLVHELAHLLNRATLGPGPPAWLEEGIANDLAFCRLDAGGRPRLGTLAGTRSLTPLGRQAALQTVSGPPASLALLRGAAAERRLPPLPSLLALPWREFVQPARRELHYAQAAFFVRYLLDGERGRLREPTRRWLAAAAAGPGAGGAEGLRDALGRSWEELEQGYLAFLQAGAEGS